MEGGDGFNRLPEACISHVLSLTSPRDSCRSAAVSAAFQSAADSDTVWERFLPPDYRQILDRMADPVEYSSKRELYFRLCDPILIDGGKMSFQLERSSGAKCYMISARELAIVWGDTPQYWKWIPVAYTSHVARFSEVAHLLDVCWLEIHGKIQTRTLSPKTNYAAYLIYKLDAASHGLRVPAQETSVKLGTHESKHKVRLQPADSEQSIGGHGLFYGFFQGIVGVTRQEICEDLEENRIPGVRNDGWMEMEMGEFFNDGGDDGEVDMCLLEVKGRHWKSGLTVLGIEVRPKK